MTSTAAAPTSYRVQAHSVSKGRSEAPFAEQSIAFDTSAGSNLGLPGPAELLCTAFAACLLKSVERFAQILPFKYEQASVKVTAWRQDRPPRFTRIHYELRVISHESQHRLELLHRNLRQFGTVYNTLAGTCDIEGALRAEARGG